MKVDPKTPWRTDYNKPGGAMRKANHKRHSGHCSKCSSHSNIELSFALDPRTFKTVDERPLCTTCRNKLGYVRKYDRQGGGVA